MDKSWGADKHCKKHGLDYDLPGLVECPMCQLLQLSLVACNYIAASDYCVSTETSIYTAEQHLEACEKQYEAEKALLDFIKGLPDVL